METTTTITFNLKELMRLNSLIVEFCEKQNPTEKILVEVRSIQLKISKALVDFISDGG